MSLRAEVVPTLVAVDSVIDEAVLRSLEPAVRALDRLFETAAVLPSEEGDPDGFDGVGRAGPPERMLSTDWLLASEVPDEFLRRYEAGELGYLKLNRSEPQRGQTSLVLFDSGPMQFGRPRVAQLACLVVLARRAASAGTELRWGTLQNDARYPANDPQALDRLLHTRTFVPPPDDLPLDAFVDDCLVVSTTHGRTAARHLELLDHGESVKAVLTDGRTNATRQAVIPMPVSEDAVRVLRHPSASPSSTTSRSVGLAPISNLVFDEQGNKLIARVEPNHLLVYPVPSSPRDRPGRIRHVRMHPDEGFIAAAGRIKKSVVMVRIAEDGETLTIQNFGGSTTALNGSHRIHDGPVAPRSSESPLGRLTWSKGALSVHLGNLEFTRLHDGYRLSATEPDLTWVHGNFVVSASPVGSHWVVRCQSDEWYHRGTKIYAVFARPSGVIGAMPTARVVHLSDDGRTLVASGDGHQEALYSAGEEIEDAVGHHRRPLYALRTKSGRVVIRSYFHEQTLHEILPG